MKAKLIKKGDKPAPQPKPKPAAKPARLAPKQLVKPRAAFRALFVEKKGE